MKIAIVVGTRPEIIKMSPVIRYCKDHKLDFFIIHTGQHYSYNLDKVLLEELGLPEARYHLEAGSGSHGRQTAVILDRIEEVLVKENPHIVLVQGDTNGVLAGALAASKLHIKVGHIEACLRSYDKLMPEEINRIIADHAADYLFAPTEDSKKNGLKENLPENRIFVTGNTIVDAVFQNIKLAEGREDIFSRLGAKKDEYILLTLHRQENVDDPNRLKEILHGLELLYRELGMNIIYPIHPRAEKMLKTFNLKLPEGLIMVPPTSFLDFLNLEKNAKLILTDSGGVQEEACILKVPCVTLRYNTERPETLSVGSNILAGTDPRKIVECSKMMIKTNRDWKNPFGNGQATEKIMGILLSSHLSK